VSAADIAAILPELTLVLAGSALVLADAFLPSARRHFGALAAIAAAAALALRWAGALPGAVWAGALRVDALARFVDTYVLAALLLVAVLADPYLGRIGKRYGEFYGLLLWSAVGAMVLAKSTHLLVIFVGLELLSIALYVLNAFDRENSISLEAGWKYLVVGAFASAIFLFGSALVFGATGSLSLAQALAPAAGQGLTSRPLLLAGLAFLLAGVGFKLALVPFHAWAPDVYQGSPTPVTAFLSVVPKGVMLIALARIVVATLPGQLTPRWVTLLAVIAVASQTLGNLVAIAQRDLKRMLAYSGIAHMGYALVGVVAFGVDGLTGILVYLAAYTFMNIAAFAVVSAFSESEAEPHLITDLAGQGWERPLLAFVLAVSMFSLAGIPPTAGFVAKFLVFRAAVNQHLVWLAVVGVLNSFISVFYYLRVVYLLYMKPLPRRAPAYVEPWPVRIVAVACALAILIAGVVPGWILGAADLAARTLMR
jgi:NADH-quinone oxidoreductase subunit N